MTSYLAQEIFEIKKQLAHDKANNGMTDTTTIEVNTGEREIANAGVSISRPDVTPVIIDTEANDEFEDIIADEEALARPKKPAMPPVIAPPPLPAAAATIEHHTSSPPPPPSNRRQHHSHRRQSNDEEEAEAEDDTVREYLDKHPDFASAMHKMTGERGGKSKKKKNQRDEEEETDSDEPSESEEESENTPPPRAKRGRHSSRIEKENEEEAEDEEDEDEDLEDGGGVGGSVPPPPMDESEDEYIEKMKIMEEIKAYSQGGAIPPKQPTFDMPISLLRKIRDYQASAIDEIMGVGFIGMAWVQLVGLIETLNSKYDPFAKAFGMGLKLNGAKTTIEENIHLYETSFKHIYRKLGLNKHKEVSPWAQLVIVTVQLLARVHMQNLEKEMMAEAASVARDPNTAERAERMRRAYEEKNKNQQTASPPPPPPPPPPQPSQAPKQPVMRPVDEIIGEDDAVEMEQPLRAENKPVVTPPSRMEDDEAEGSDDGEEEDSDDDVIVQIPKSNKK